VIRRFILRLLIMALVVGAAAALVPGIRVHGGFFTLVWIGFLLSLVNAIVGPVLRLLALPLIVLTLGLFLLVVNAALLALTAALSNRLDIDSFGAAVLGGLVIAVLSWLCETVLPLRKRTRQQAAARR
jgi:putative membrane protein